MVEYIALYNNIEYANKDEWERMRLQTFLLKQAGYLKKECKIKDYIPFSWEKFKGSTEADNKLVEQYKKFKQKWKEDHKK